MPDYVEYDGSGNITKSYRSVDPSVISGKQVIEITRAQLDSLTEYFLVKTGVLTPMDAGEISAYDTAKAAQAVLDLQAKINAFDIDALTLFKALVKVINIRLPSNKITIHEIADEVFAIKNS